MQQGDIILAVSKWVGLEIFSARPHRVPKSSQFSIKSPDYLKKNCWWSTAKEKIYSNILKDGVFLEVNKAKHRIVAGLWCRWFTNPPDVYHDPGAPSHKGHRISSRCLNKHGRLWGKRFRTHTLQSYHNRAAPKRRHLHKSHNTFSWHLRFCLDHPEADSVRRSHDKTCNLTRRLSQDCLEYPSRDPLHKWAACT